MRSSAVLLACWMLGASPAAAELVDRIVAVIDRDVITLSEAEDARRVAEIDSDGRSVSLPEAVDALIETRLIEREVERFGAEPVPDELLTEARQRLRSRFDSEASFEEALESRGLSEAALEELLRRQLTIHQYLEKRFRALTYVTEEEAEAFFREEILPELPEGSETLFSEHEEAVRRLLEERKFNDRVDEWLEELRSSAEIRRYVW